MKNRLMMLAFMLVPVLAGAATREQRDFAQIMSLKPDPEHGAVLFQGCMECHGADGGGVATGSVPRIAGQHYSVLVRQVVQFRGGKHWDMRMEGVASRDGMLPRPQDIADVAAYVNGLGRDGKRGVGQGEFLDIGRTVYQANCASCHGKDGEGDERREVPRLAGQHAGYLARQIYDAVDGRRPALAGSHRRQLVPLTFEEVLGMTDYLSRLGWNAAD
jgi:cytochrome c553